jgi:hypothetical protein
VSGGSLEEINTGCRLFREDGQIEGGTLPEDVPAVQVLNSPELVHHDG